MEVMPVSVGRTSRAWDEQHVDVTAAARQLGAAVTTGFTDGVAGAAARFASTWQRHTTELAVEAEARADALRTAIADYLATDRAVGLDVLALRSYLVEQR
jgi:hypothetical protein